MTEVKLNELLLQLVKLPAETEWLEFKHNKADPEEIGEYLSALANSAVLHQKDQAYLIWGIDNTTHEVLGTDFHPHARRIGNEELQNWLAQQLSPRIDFRIYEFQCEGKPIILIKVPPAIHTPVRFRDTEFIRVGSYKKKLKDFPEKERSLWAQFQRWSFEKGIAATSVSPQQVIDLLDYTTFFELLGHPLPENLPGILKRLISERVVFERGNSFDISNLGALLFARNLQKFEMLARKAPRVILYRGNDRLQTIQEQVGTRGYAVAFMGLINYIDSRLPRNEEINKALRQEVQMYPPIAIRELVANALIHQDFKLTGTGPMVEIFSDRIEITNPGTPLIDILRFIDEPPQSRNETLAALMRRLNICEERGSGIDKVISQVELFQLPAPDFQVMSNHTKVILYAPKKLSQMDRADRIRACYQHACLCSVSNQKMTNATLRTRFGILEKNYAMASRIISETIAEKLIKPYNPESNSKKHASYAPFWL